jgi:hypothetical protein
MTVRGSCLRRSLGPLFLVLVLITGSSVTFAATSEGVASSPLSPDASQPSVSGSTSGTGSNQVPSVPAPQVSPLATGHATRSSITFASPGPGAVQERNPDRAPTGDECTTDPRAALPLAEFAVTFNATGIRSGEMWTVGLNGTWQNSISSSIVFNEPNGTYHFEVASVAGYSTAPDSGNVTVNGNPVNQTISFSSVYPVIFTETGLPTGTDWYLNVSEAPSIISPSTTAVIDLGNGSYNYTLGSANKLYGPSPGAGTFTVSGGLGTVAVNFALETYEVSFETMGLPNGTNWNVTLGDRALSSPTSYLNASEPNGTYAYVVEGIPGYEIVNASYRGLVTVNGREPPVITIAWMRALTIIEFTESGLPHGTKWRVAIGTHARSINSSSFAFYLPNGTYLFAIYSAGYTATTNPTGPLEINGEPYLLVSVRFSLGAAPSDFPVVNDLLLGGALFALAIALLAARRRRKRKVPSAEASPAASSTDGNSPKHPDYGLRDTDPGPLVRSD